MSKYRNIKSDRLAALFKVLGNEHRLRIYVRLTQCCPPGTKCDIEGQLAPCVSELGKDIGIVPSTLSHHIKELRLAGLIQIERNGQKRQCWVVPEALAELKSFFGELGI